MNLEEIRRDTLLSNAARLSENGAFRSYLFRFQLTNNFPLCTFCGVEVTAEHALFLMPKVDQETGEVRRLAGTSTDRKQHSAKDDRGEEVLGSCPGHA